jgi:hypothetical protein
MHRIAALMMVLALLISGFGVSMAQTGAKSQKKSQKSKQTSKSAQKGKQTQTKPKSGQSGAQKKPETGQQSSDKPRPPANTDNKPKEEPSVNYGALPLIKLFNGTDLKGWKLRNADGKNCWTVVDGVLTNTDRGTDLVSEEKFTDFELHVEVRVPKGGNSGVYLQGRYEIQVGDTADMKDLTNSMMGAIYSKIAPKLNAAKPAGEWQTLDVHFMQAVRDATGKIIAKPEVTVVLNDEIIIDRGEIDGPTGGALDSDEGTPGPIMLQGDHTAVEYRNILIRKLPPREAPKEEEEENPPIPPKQDHGGSDNDR